MNNIFKKFALKSLCDIVLTGVVDVDDGEAEFIPQLDRIHLTLEEGIVKLSLDAEKLQIDFEIVAQVRPSRVADEEYLPCHCSIGGIILSDPLADNRIKNCVLYNPADEGHGSGAIELNLASGQVIFFDPLSYDGISVGGVESRSSWIENSVVANRILIE